MASLRFGDVAIGDPRDGVLEIEAGNMQLAMKPAPTAVAVPGGQQAGVRPVWQQLITAVVWCQCPSVPERLGYAECLASQVGNDPGVLAYRDGKGSTADGKKWGGCRLVAVNELMGRGGYTQLKVAFQREVAQ